MPNYFEVAEKGIELAKTCKLLPFEEVDAASVAAKVIRELAPEGAKALTTNSESTRTEQQIAEILQAKLQDKQPLPLETAPSSADQPKLTLSDAARARLATLNEHVAKSLSDLVANYPARYVPMVEQQLDGNTPVELLNKSERIFAIASIYDSVTPETFTAFRALEKQDPEILNGVANAVKVPEGLDLLNRAIQGDAPTEFLHSSNMWGHIVFAQKFGSESSTMHRVEELARKGELDLREASRVESPDLLQHLLNSEGGPQTLNKIGSWGSPFVDFQMVVGDRPKALVRAVELSESGEFDFAKVNRVMNNRPERGATVADELERGAEPARIENARWLSGVEQTTKSVGGDSYTLSKAVAYGEQNKLSMWQFGSYLAGAPQERLPLVRELLNKGNLDGINALTKLRMFAPQSTGRDSRIYIRRRITRW